MRENIAEEREAELKTNKLVYRILIYIYFHYWINNSDIVCISLLILVLEKHHKKIFFITKYEIIIIKK